MNWAGAALTEALSIAAVSSGLAVRSRFSAGERQAHAVAEGRVGPLAFNDRDIPGRLPELQDPGRGQPGRAATQNDYLPAWHGISIAGG